MLFLLTEYPQKNKRRLKLFLVNRCYLILLLITAIFILSTSQIIAQTNTVTYQKNTDHELTIYFINGKEQGKTMMIVGGIQGDEPGGYLAADLYADIMLEKGNMIIVPRANFNSIILNDRGVNGDMNRKFANSSENLYDKDLYIVDTLKSLISKSDILLNLHDGSGFYNPEYISEMQNPMRFGQSIIADAALYTNQVGKTINLEETARRVIDKVNQNIKEPENRFRFNNHDTLSETSTHKEQRKSATFYALTDVGIPAFGIETSKDIQPTTKKVKYQTLIINAFMAEYGIIPEHPSVFLPVPELDYLVVQIVGNENSFAVKNGGTLSMPEGASIHVSNVVANYKRGISIDIIGEGNNNDIGRVAVINSPTTIKVYKDAYLCGEVKIETTNKDVSEAKNVLPYRLKQIEINIDNKKVIVSNGDTLHIVKGDLITITDAWTGNFSQSGFRVNFVGFVGNKNFNDAEDRGYTIDTARDFLEHRSLNNEGLLYQIEAQELKDKKVIGTVYVSIKEPEIEYLILENMDGTKLALTPGSIVNCNKKDKFKVLSVISNITVEPYVDTLVINEMEQSKKLILPAVLEISSEVNIQFRRASQNLGSISFRISG